MIGNTVTHYRVLDQLGHGGMGVVYRAVDIRLGRHVALKFLPESTSTDPVAVERFIREAKAASALNHPNICTIYEVDQHETRHFIAMELLEGQTLRDLIAGSPLPFQTVLALGVEIADSLEAAHQAGVVHRDLKPANVYVTGRGHAKILDFGLAKMSPEIPGMPQSVDSSADTLSYGDGLTVPGTAIGTVDYMSPEQARGEETDRRTDIFSLSVVLYEMATGRRPFQGDTVAVVFDGILNRKPHPLSAIAPDLPADFVRIIHKGLEKDRAARYQAMADLLTDLERIRRAVDADKDLVRLADDASAEMSPPIGSLAVLPFTNQSADPDAEYLSDGITETIINNMSKLSSTLRVVPRSAVFRYKGPDIDPIAAGKALSAQAVLSGRVMLRGDILIVRAEMVDVTNESQLWGEQYRSSLSDVFTIEEEIASGISDRLRVRLTGEDHERARPRYEPKPEAYQHYLRGRYFWTKRGDGLRKGIEYFQRAIEADSGYALPHAGLADCFTLMHMYGVGSGKDLGAKARASVIRALELDPGLAEAHAALFLVKLTYEWDWEGVRTEYEQARRADPNCTFFYPWYALSFSARGRHDEALDVVRKGLELDPLWLSIQFSHQLVLYLSGRFEEATELSKKVIEIDPTYPASHLYAAESYEQLGRYEEALEEYELSHQLYPAALTRAEMGRCHALAGHTETAVQILEELRARAKQNYVSDCGIAGLCTTLGLVDEAFEWIERALDNREWLCIFLNVDPIYARLRSDPRFRTATERVGL